MKTSPKSMRDSRCFAVIRNYEPCRIEHDLLAKVFEALSQAVVGNEKASRETSLPPTSIEDLVPDPSEFAPARLCSLADPVERPA